MNLKPVWDFSKEQLESVFRYRHTWVTRLGWLKPNAEGMDYDKYDFLPTTQHLLVVDDEKPDHFLVYMRATAGQDIGHLMLGNEFRSMIQNADIFESFRFLIANHRCVEVTRFLPNLDLPKDVQRQVRHFSYHVMVRWVAERDVDYIILFTSAKIPPDLANSGLQVPILRDCGDGLVTLAIDIKATMAALFRAAT